MVQPTTKSSHSVIATRDHGNLRWVDYARRSMQRLGFVKLVLRLASRPQTLESLTRAFAASITRVSPVLPNMMDSFSRYVREQNLQKQRYRGELASAQIQDMYLSDPFLPSRSGAITGDFERKGYRHSVYVEITTWAARLRLLRAQNYTVTDRGRVLLSFGEHLEESSDVGERNPLYLNLSERYVALFCLLDTDGDLLRAMYKQLLKRSKPFTRADAGDAAVKGLVELRRMHLKNIGPGPLQRLRAKADRTIAAVQKQNYGGLGPRESIATPRTEPLVDCGLLSRRYPDTYVYSFTNWGREFLTTLVSEASVNNFLQSNLSSAMSLAAGKDVSTEGLTLEALRQPYMLLRSGLGYVSLRELAVATVAQALPSPDVQLFEIGAIEQVLRQAAGRGDRQVRLAAGRSGDKVQVRIDQKAFKHNDSGA